MLKNHPVKSEFIKSFLITNISNDTELSIIGEYSLILFSILFNSTVFNCL